MHADTVLAAAAVHAERAPSLVTRSLSGGALANLEEALACAAAPESALRAGARQHWRVCEKEPGLAGTRIVVLK